MVKKSMNMKEAVFNLAFIGEPAFVDQLGIVVSLTCTAEKKSAFSNKSFAPPALAGAVFFRIFNLVIP